MAKPYSNLTKRCNLCTTDVRKRLRKTLTKKGSFNRRKIPPNGNAVYTRRKANNSQKKSPPKTQLAHAKIVRVICTRSFKFKIISQRARAPVARHASSVHAFLTFPLPTLGGSPSVFLNTINSKRNQFANWPHDSLDSTCNFSYTGVAITSRIHFNNSSQWPTSSWCIRLNHKDYITNG